MQKINKWDDFRDRRENVIDTYINKKKLQLSLKLFVQIVFLMQ